MVLKTNFEQKLEVGRNGELILENVLQNYGWHTIPTYDYKSEYKKSPRMVGKNSFLRLPDIDASKNGKRIWIESKWKEGASWTYSKRTFEHGIPLYLYDEYLKVEKITGDPVWIFFIEGNQAKLTQIEMARCIRGGKAIPPNRDNYPINILRGQLLSSLKSTRIQFMESTNHIFFNQADLLYFGVIVARWQVPFDIGETFTSISILEQP